MGDKKLKIGLIAKTLTHSFSKIIHEKYFGSVYDLIETEKQNIKNILYDENYDGFNVTIPYKKEVIKLLDELKDKAFDTNVVNTIVRDKNILIGFNTDYYGLKFLIKYNNFDLKNSKVLILGTGGTSVTAHKVAFDLGAKEIIYVTHNDLDDYTDFDYIINTTPVGMFPNISEIPNVDIAKFSNLKAIIDVVYNPINTRFILKGKKEGIKTAGGLLMLVAQAVYANYIFQNKNINDSIFNDTKFDNKIIDIYNKILDMQKNIVIIGMPGSGKTTYGKEISKNLCKEFIDTDLLIEEKEHDTCKNIIMKKGIDYFRDVEKKIIEQVSTNTNKIISTGGGVILDYDNIINLKLNGEIWYLKKDLDKLVIDNTRPLSDTKEKLTKLYNDRVSLYEKYADKIIEE